MKKMTFKNRIVAFGMAIAISASTLFGCGFADYDELRNALEGNAAVETQQQETTVEKETLQEENQDVNPGANQSDEMDAFNKRLEELEKNLNVLVTENESLKGTVTELEAANGELEATVSTLQQEAVESEAENAKLSETLKRVQELRKQVTREFREFRENAGEFFGFFKDSRGDASAEFDYAYTRSMVEAESGLWYYLIGSANEVEIYDMRSAESNWQPKYAEADFFVAANENFQIIGKNAETGEMGLYQLHAGGGISYVGPTTENGFAMQKVARIQWQTGGYLHTFATSMSYHEVDGEYLFYLTDGYVKPTPKPATKPQEPEVIVKTETVEVEVCFTCGKDKATCPGHKETVTNTEKVEVCFTCGKDKATCPGHKETVTKTETVTVEKCFTCGKDKTTCPGHKETVTNTVYQDRIVYQDRYIYVDKEPNTPENNPARPDDDEFVDEGPADMPTGTTKEPENNPARPNDNEFVDEGPADMPADGASNTPENNQNVDDKEFADEGPADMATSSANNSGPADMDADNNSSSNDTEFATNSNGPADMADNSPAVDDSTFA